MTTIALENTELELRSVIEQLKGGEEVIITRNSKPIARLSGIPKNNSLLLKNSFAGKIWTSPDFDEPLEEFKDLGE